VTDHIRIGVYPRETGRIIVAPLHVGIDRGYFADVDVEVEICEPADHPWLAAGRGDIDCGLSYIDYCSWEQLLGKIVAVAVHEQFTPGRGMTCLMARTELLESGRLTDDPASLKGLRIGLLPGRGDDYLCFRGILDQGGLTMDDVEREPVPHGGQARRKWVQEGSVDVIIGRRPASIADEIADGHVRVWKAGDDIYAGFQARYLVANTDFLATSRPVLLRFLEAYIRGVGDVLGSYERAKTGDLSGLAHISLLTGEPIDHLRSIKPVGYHPTGAIDMPRLEAEVTKLREAGLFPSDLAIDAVVDTSCIAEVAQRATAGSV
jgi:ABC-type nitrate/sulfonate/bicarbonate transport system substrate-binding protein